MYGILRRNCCTRAINLERYDFISYFSFFSKNRKQRCIQREEKDVACSARWKLLRIYYENIFRFCRGRNRCSNDLIFENNFRNFLYIFVHRMFQRAWRRLLKNLKLMTAYWKFIKAIHGMPVYFIPAKLNHRWAVT